MVWGKVEDGEEEAPIAGAHVIYDVRIELPDGNGASGLLDTYGSLTVRMFMSSGPLQIEVIK